MLTAVPDGAAQRYPDQFGQRCESMAEAQVEGVDGDAEAVGIGMVDVVVVVAGTVEDEVGVLDPAFAATTMLKERLEIRCPALAVTRNWTTWRSDVELARMWTVTS
jgi:hypothetical protein